MKLSKETLVPLAGGIVIGTVANTVAIVVLVVHGLRKNDMIRKALDDTAKDMIFEITERIIYGEKRLNPRRVSYNMYGGRGRSTENNGQGPVPVPKSEEK